MTVVDAQQGAVVALAAALFAVATLPDALVYLAALWIFREVYFRPTVTDPMPIPELATDLDEDAKLTKANPRVCVVTGASGFLARHLINHLAASGDYDEVRAIDIVEPVYADAKVRPIVANICDAEAVLKFVRGADAVFHVASLIELRDHKYRCHRLFDVNVTGAINVVNACIRTGATRLIYTASAATVMDGRTPKDGRWVEENFADVRIEDLPCYYAKTKKMAEDAVLAANGRGRLHTCSLRPFVPFGPGDKLQTHRLVHEDYVIQTHEGLNCVAYVYCKNAAHWHALAAKALAEKPEQAGGQGYFISNGEDGVVTVKELRDGIFRHRTRSYKYNTYLTNRMRQMIFLGNAIVEWVTAGRAQHHILMCNQNAMPYTIWEGPFDCSKGAAMFGYTPLYTMEEAYADSVREISASA